MRSTTIGLKLTHIAALTFVFSFFIGDYLPLFLMIAYALLIEKDEWLTRQAISALLLKTVFSCVFVVVAQLIDQYIALKLKNSAFGDLSELSGLAKTMTGGANSHWLLSLIGIIWFVFAAMATYNVINGKEAGIPVIQDLFEKKL